MLAVGRRSHPDGVVASRENEERLGKAPNSPTVECPPNPGHFNFPKRERTVRLGTILVNRHSVNAPEINAHSLTLDIVTADTPVSAPRSHRVHAPRRRSTYFRFLRSQPVSQLITRAPYNDAWCLTDASLKQASGRASSYLEVRRGRSPAFYESVRSTSPRYADRPPPDAGSQRSTL